MNKKIIYTDKNSRELGRVVRGDFPIRIEHERLSEFIKNTIPFHWHPEFEMFSIREGCVICQTNDRILHLKKGDGMFINTNVLHALFPDKGNDCIYNTVVFDASLLGQPGGTIYDSLVTPVLTNTSLESFYFSKNIPWQKEILCSIEEIITLEFENSPCLELEILERMARIWKLFYKNTVNILPQISHSTRDITRMKQAMTFIQNYYQQPITLTDISNSCSLSQSECCRLFKRILHQSPVEYVVSVRVNKSLPLLAEDSLTITEIAGLTGFQSSSYFAETFRKLTGISPSQYRKQIKEKKIDILTSEGV